MDTTQLLKGALDTAVLAVVQHDDGYGYDIVRRLRDAGLGDVGDASVYGTLRRLYAAGALSSYVVPSEGGPHRKYYAINPEGRELLAGQRATWAAFATAMSGLLGEPAPAPTHHSRKAGATGEGPVPASVNVRTIGEKP
ncbi:PadR family transcriptional regulator [Clavibacter michiganensis]|uniref:PadR family transcriptional regulator n=1 Tax=Clavibacter michiganensis TaxID=28447 RepID=UPI000CE84E93|nr:PadR family transcriptional regulator [Clavibacter michiganensis]PPF89821.1 PadR family transcriptional regulator [Clavibacter michiganensis]PPF97825.1 PadR family transcriptional regulator [Clavibacter michiganensis]